MEIKEIKQAMVGKWIDFYYSNSTCIQPDQLTGKHQPCPQCGGTDRFRCHQSFNENAKVICSHCTENHYYSEFNTLMWATGLSFPEALQMVKNYLGIDNNYKPKPITLEEQFAKDKNVSLDKLIVCGLKKVSEATLNFPSYRIDSDGQPYRCGGQDYHYNKERREWITRNEKGKQIGLYLPHSSDGKPLIPEQNEEWIICEGVKDLAAWLGLGFQFVAGSNNCDFLFEYSFFFTKTHIVLAPDKDEAGYRGARKAARMMENRCKSVSCLHLPLPMKKKDGEPTDLRDCLVLGKKGQVIQAFENRELIYGNKTSNLERDDKDVIGLLPELKELYTLKKEYTTTGIAALDHVCGNIEEGSLITIAALPGHGKTFLGLQMCYQGFEKHKTCFISLEMTPVKIARRVGCFLTGKTAGVFEKDLDINLADLKKTLQNKPEFKIIKRGSDKDELLESVRTKLKEGFKTIVIDHFNRIRFKNMYNESFEIYIELKQLAEEYSAYIFMLHQINHKRFENHKSKIPTLSTLENGNAAEQNSDFIFIGSHPYKVDPDEPKNDYFIRVAKVREADAGGIVELELKPETGQMIDKFDFGGF